MDYKEKVIALLKSQELSKEQKEKLEGIFPELAESDDEKIRKAIVKYFTSKITNPDYEICGVPFKEVLVWLEKQGEKKPNFCHHEVDLSGCSEEYRKAYYDGWNNCNMQHSQCNSELEDVAKCLINGMKFYYEDDEEATWGTDKWSMPVKYIIKVLENQGEQKPADKVEPKFKVGDVIRLKGSAAEYTIKRVTDTTYYTNGWSCSIERCEEDYELVEQKSVWSEEDEMRFNNIFTLLEELPLSQNWLKSIKDKVRLQPRQEWSEGDKRIIDNLISQLGNLYARKLIKEGTKDKYVNWLKNLKDKVFPRF